MGQSLSAADVYYFMNGGWRKVGSGNTLHNDDVVLPDMYLIVRHNVATNTTLLTEGAVVSTALRAHIRRQPGTKQNNSLALGRPVSVSLNDSGLLDGDAFQISLSAGARADELLTFDNSVPERNRSASAAYYHYSNAWRKLGAPSVDAGPHLLFTPGTGFILRSAPAQSSATWLNQPTY